MITDHTAVNRQASALVKKLGVKPEESATSKKAEDARQQKRREPQPEGRRIRQGVYATTRWRITSSPGRDRQGSDSNAQGTRS